MCGIAGIRRFDGAAPDSGSLHAMGEALRHRGPDDSGQWHSGGGTAFVHTRLSIIDLSDSQQPMVSADGRYVLAFNGEVLNYRQLRQATSYPYRTAGDTEAILAAHTAYGPEATAKLRGQFAYALLDNRTGDLTLARDPLGILPLYWYQDDEQFLFASELTALIAGLGRVPDIDEDGLADYLRGRSVPAPRTLLSGIHKVRPGHTLRVTETGSVSESAYWAPSPRAVMAHDPSEAVAELDGLLRNAVETALIADVPVGAYLSGGVDSSLIVSKVAAELGHRGVHTYCAAFGDPRMDEAQYAEQVSELMGTTHQTVQVRPSTFVDLWPKLSAHRGGPLSEPADVAVYQLALAAREDVKVVLSGEGSDELFGGYPKYRFADATKRAGIVPAALRGPLLRTMSRHLPPRGRRLEVALRALSEPTEPDRIQGWFAPFDGDERRRLLSAKPSTIPYTDHPGTTPLRRMLVHDLWSWLPDNLLERGDRMTMAASVEARPPFLDLDVVEFALRLPDDLLVRDGVGKWLVKQVALTHLPESIVNRQKVGFKVPLDAWFRGGLQEYARDLVTSTDSVSSTYLDSTVVDKLFDNHDNGSRDESIRIWTLTSLEVWHRSLRDTSTASATPAL